MRCYTMWFISTMKHKPHVAAPHCSLEIHVQLRQLSLRFNHHQRVSWWRKWKQDLHKLRLAGIYLFKLNNWNTRERYEIQRHQSDVNYVVGVSIVDFEKFYSLFALYSGVSIVEFEQKYSRLGGIFFFIWMGIFCNKNGKTYFLTNLLFLLRFSNIMQRTTYQ